MKITFPEKQEDVAELSIDGKLVSYRIPPVTGTHSECFKVFDAKTRAAQGYEIAAFVYGALTHKKNEWADQSRIRFPTSNYLRAPEVLTMVQNRKEFGDLAGAMIVDSDLEGDGIGKQTEVPKTLDGWIQTSSGIMVRDGRIAVPMNKWYADTWDAKNGAVIALFGEEGAEILEKSAVDSGRSYKPLWKVDVNSIKTPERRVPIMNGYAGDGLDLNCDYNGDYRGGCAVRVLK